jgi:hypothetical protein
MKNHCKTVSKSKIFTFEEQRSKLTLLNIDEVLSIKIHVDGCQIDNKKIIKCDYLHIAKEIEMYIELKGQDILHAIEQLKSTMHQLSINVKEQSKICYIICTRSPLSSTEIQKYDRDFRRDFNAKLIVKSSPFTDKY